MRGVRAKPKAQFWYNVQKEPVAQSGGALFGLRRLTLILSLTVIWVAGNQLRGHLQVILILGRRETMGNSMPDVVQPSMSSQSSSSVVQVGTLPNFLDQWNSITCSRFVFNGKRLPSSAYMSPSFIL